MINAELASDSAAGNWALITAPSTNLGRRAALSARTPVRDVRHPAGGRAPLHLSASTVQTANQRLKAVRMTTSETKATRATRAGAESPDRISVRKSILPGTVVDGAWWPRSSDLTVELPRLVRNLWGDKATDVRVAYHLGTWDAAPRKIFIGKRMIRLGGFVHQDPLVISLSGAVA